MPPKSRKLLAPALSLSLLACAFTFDGRGIHWLWTAQPVLVALLAAGAAASWLFLLLGLRERSRPA